MVLKNTDEGDPSEIFRAATSILGINGIEVPLDEAINFIENLLPGDTHRFRACREEFEGRMDTTIYHECSYCSEEQDFVMPFTAEFFRPSWK